MSVDLITLKSLETSRWSKAQTVPRWQPIAAHVAAQSLAFKAKYQEVEKTTSVPWWFVSIVHELEASRSWNASLAQGDPWNHVSIHVPRGRGPFKSWSDAAIDALANCSPYAAKNKDWSIGGSLLMFEEYNGLGYARMNIPSPYLWSGTDQYKSGKYVADGHFDPHAVSGQLGCATILKELMKIDQTIKIA